MKELFVCALVGMSLQAVAATPESAFDRDPWPEAKEGPVKVFLLAGQSNMQGQAALRTLEYLVYNEETAADYEHWKDRNGNWNERRDVWVWTTDGERHGYLKPGYGANPDKLGPELGFGWVVGEQLDEQVLLIKTCWGGRSVRKDFLPPSAGMPPDEELQQPLERAREKRPETTLEDIKKPYGLAYRDTIRHTREVLARLDELFPGYKEERGWELAGFVFFQGWNDMVDGSQREEKYARFTERLALMVQDLRKDLNVPNLPVVIGELGAGGKRGDFQAAQAAAAEKPGLGDLVRVVPTAQFWEPDVEELVKQGVWKGPDWVRFYNVGSDKGYHYLGSARIYTSIGRALGESMIELLGP